LRKSSGASSFTMILVSKSKARRETEIFMGRPCVAVDAAVLTAAVGIDARVKPDIRTIVIGDDALGVVRKELRQRR
jgi:hypothetical protein